MVSRRSLTDSREGLIKSTDSVLQALTADAKNKGSVKR